MGQSSLPPECTLPQCWHTIPVFVAWVGAVCFHWIVVWIVARQLHERLQLEACTIIFLFIRVCSAALTSVNVFTSLRLVLSSTNTILSQCCWVVFLSSWRQNCLYDKDYELVDEFYCSLMPLLRDRRPNWQCCFCSVTVCRHRPQSLSHVINKSVGSLASDTMLQCWMQ